MAGTTSHPQTGFLSRSWRDSAAWVRVADILAVLVALSLPWSTSLVAIFIVIFLFSLIPAFDPGRFVETVKRPVSWAPIALFAVALLGMAWASDISWAARLHGLAPVAKLLLIPAFIYQFERSGRGGWVLGAFLVSCSVVLALSWYLHFADFTWSYFPGVPVKNPIAQSQEFAFCIFGLAALIVLLVGERRLGFAVGLTALAVAFMFNMIFVLSSRTPLISITVLLFVFAAKHFRRSGVIFTIAIALLIAAIFWVASSNLRERVNRTFAEFQSYEQQNAATSTGMRLEFWRKSIKFIEASPLIGHGTGSTRTLFERDAVGQTGVSAEVIDNPHNQMLNVAVQWGIVGLVALYAVWIAHLRLFATAPGLAGWIGLVAVIENFVSSIFNSHLFDFTEGWLYVLAVGIAGGMIFGGRPANSGSAAERAEQ